MSANGLLSTNRVSHQKSSGVTLGLHTSPAPKECALSLPAATGPGCRNCLNAESTLPALLGSYKPPLVVAEIQPLLPLPVKDSLGYEP
jgi:hypothetical protein